MDEVIKNKNCLSCVYFGGIIKDLTASYYCSYGSEFCATLDVSELRLIVETGSNQCITGKIPDWCPLESDKNKS